MIFMIYDLQAPCHRGKWPKLIEINKIDKGYAKLSKIDQIDNSLAMLHRFDTFINVCAFFHQLLRKFVQVLRNCELILRAFWKVCSVLG